MANTQSTTLEQALTTYLASLAPEQRGGAGTELTRFVRWFGGERALSRLAAADVDRYRAQIAQSGADLARLRPLRDFLAYLDQQHLSQHPLAPALRVPRSPGAPRRAAAPTAEQRTSAPSQREASKPAAPEERSAASATIRCPRCAEEEALRGQRQGEAISVRCERCGHTWTRDLRPACPTCGRTDLLAVQEPLVEKVRGSQTAIMGTRTVYRCPACDR